MLIVFLGIVFLINGGLFARISTVGTLQKAKTSVNKRDYKGRTPLHLLCLDYRATKKTFSNVKALINQGADLFALDNNGMIPLHTFSSRMKRFRIRNKYSRKTALLLALKSQKKINLQDNFGNTALHYAVASGADDIFIKFLLSQGADPFIENNQRKAAFHYLDFAQGIAIWKALLFSEKVVSFKDYSLRNFLHEAVLGLFDYESDGSSDYPEEHVALIKKALGEKFDVLLVDKDLNDKTPLDYSSDRIKAALQGELDPLAITEYEE